MQPPAGRKMAQLLAWPSAPGILPAWLGRLLVVAHAPARPPALMHHACMTRRRLCRDLHKQVVSQVDTLLSAASAPGAQRGEQAAMRRFATRLDELQAQVSPGAGRLAAGCVLIPRR